MLKSRLGEAKRNPTPINRHCWVTVPFTQPTLLGYYVVGLQRNVGWALPTLQDVTSFTEPTVYRKKKSPQLGGLQLKSKTGLEQT